MNMPSEPSTPGADPTPALREPGTRICTGRLPDLVRKRKWRDTGDRKSVV